MQKIILLQRKERKGVSERQHISGRIFSVRIFARWLVVECESKKNISLFILLHIVYIQSFIKPLCSCFSPLQLFFCCLQKLFSFFILKLKSFFYEIQSIPFILCLFKLSSCHDKFLSFLFPLSLVVYYTFFLFYLCWKIYTGFTREP